MSVLKERLEQMTQGATYRPQASVNNTGGNNSLRAGSISVRAQEINSDLAELKGRVHRILINRLDLAKLEKADPQVMQIEVRRAIERILDEENAPLSGLERERVGMEYRMNELNEHTPYKSLGVTDHQ